MYKKNANSFLLVVLIATALTMIATSLGKYTETVSTAITLNITKPTYTVRFHPNNGGPDNYTTQSFTYGTSQALDANTFTNGSQSMLGWTTNSDGTGDSYDDEEVITTGLTQTNEAIIDLYAKWGNAEYWVTYVYGDESFTGPTGAKYINSDLALFSEANIDRDFEVSLSVSNFEHVSSQDRDLIISHQCEHGEPYQGFSFGYRDGAIRVQLKSSRTTQNTYSWGKTSGNITFKKEGAGANRKMYVDGVEQISMSDFAGTFESPSLIFGANVGDDGNSRRYLHADLSDMTIKLKYTYVEIQQLFTNLPNPTHTGYSFGGWYTAQVGGTKVTSSTPITSTNIVLYARWENAGLVTFDANGGTGAMSSQSFTPGQNQKLAINGFSRTGYSFVGWNTSADGTGTSYSEMQVPNFGGDITLYAQWEPFHTGTDYFYANGSVRFNKNNSDIINTGINLFSQTNYSRNFEAYFEILEVGSNSHQACLINSKNETASPWPGFVVRTNSNKLQLKADRAVSNNDPTNTYTDNNLSSTTTQSIRIIRINGETYYSINNGTFQTLLDFTGFESIAVSDTPVAFGGFIKPNGDLGRPFNGVLANMYVGFIDGNITLSDYQGGYTAPRTGGASLTSSMPLNASAALNSSTLQEIMESDIVFIDGLLSEVSEIDEEEETEEIIEKENAGKDEEEIFELDEADDIEVFDEEENETQITENNETKTEDTTEITTEDDKTNTQNHTEASSLEEDETASLETKESESQEKEENIQAEAKEEIQNKEESIATKPKEEETQDKEETIATKPKEEEKSEKEESTTVKEKEETPEKEELTTVEEKKETLGKEEPTTVEEKEETPEKEEPTTVEEKEETPRKEEPTTVEEMEETPRKEELTTVEEKEETPEKHESTTTKTKEMETTKENETAKSDEGETTN